VRSIADRRGKPLASGLAGQRRADLALPWAGAERSAASEEQHPMGCFGTCFAKDGGGAVGRDRATGSAQNRRRGSGETAHAGDDRIPPKRSSRPGESRRLLRRRTSGQASPTLTSAMPRMRSPAQRRPGRCFWCDRRRLSCDGHLRDARIAAHRGVSADEASDRCRHVGGWRRTLTCNGHHKLRARAAQEHAPARR
jgi:hypothetical protein